MVGPEIVDEQTTKNGFKLIKGTHHVEAGGVKNILVDIPGTGNSWRVRALYEREPLLHERLRERVARFLAAAHFSSSFNPHPEAEEKELQVAEVEFRLY
jgi:hypothetical protein